jgi:FAD/FMN-containing dehydrogenase
MKPITRRTLLLGTGAVIGGYASKRYTSLNPPLDGTRSLIPNPNPSFPTLNDKSLLSQTPIHKHIIVPDDPGEKMLAALRAELKDANANNRCISLSAARHSMGGQSIPRDGHAITFETDFFEPDTNNQIYRCSSGLKWSSAIGQMDKIGFGPKVMQSNSDFGIASTFCVNAHGWPVPYSAMGSTTRSFKMLLADGQHVNCSRDENQDLFSLTMGGYGLTGLITEMQVEMVPNARLKPAFEEMPSREFGPKFISALADPTVQMAYGRLNVDRDRFFEDGLMITYRPTSDQSDLPAVAGSGFISKAAAKLFRAQLGNERMKRARWWVETDLGSTVAAGETTRNNLINEPVITLDDGDPNRTDILHEYFVSPDRFAEFIDVCKQTIPTSYQEMLNITLRYVATDTDSVLTYATEPRIACVMLFSQEMTVRAEADHKRMTQNLIEGTLAIGGTYYLPYRPHARLDQFKRGYSRMAEFVDRKRAIDPNLRFRNNLWDTYLSKI